MEQTKRVITPQAENFPEWYQDVVREAGLAEVSEVRGCGIIKPYGYKIWELIKAELSKKIEATGAENVYFPLFVPIANLEAEADHVEGFSPELAVVTHAGGEELTEKLAVRPTSEAAMYTTYAKWVQSYRDLPMRLNQWNNVVRWEKRPRAFLRWSEFQWQEGHSVFADEATAVDEVWQMLGVYKDMYAHMAIPVVDGKKSDMEKFAGAVMTTTVEAMARDGKAIQGGTSHYLGTNFAKVFDVKYLGADGEHHLAHQTSWGMSWRSVGALIMAHGDDNGLRLPPNVAPIQVVIVPIYKDENKDTVLAYAREVANSFSGMRVHVDVREGQTPGFKFNEWEVKGVPVRLEIGGKEADEKALTVYRRDTGVKEKISADGAKEYIEKLFVDIHETLYNQAYDFLTTHIHRIESIDDIDDRIGYFEASWSETPESEKMLKERFAMVSRVLPREFEGVEPKNTKCFITGEPAKHDWYFAKSY
ncbi:MAG: proline--tRNA ligase [Candidatus Yonathbacteria bacterium]|nr:proline--tRNA ligase [Candidatus Yonathbacteria bacterium]NTW47343.1 proline--tRNA ligase [Candidatus Yonathbacteria bacterium]